MGETSTITSLINVRLHLLNESSTACNQCEPTMVFRTVINAQGIETSLERDDVSGTSFFNKQCVVIALSRSR